jgi:Tfp pilus assembly protein PilZ
VRRRRYRRRTVRILVDFVGESGPRCEYATTLGAGGLFVETEEPLEPGRPIKVRFRLSRQGALHAIEGRVAWAHHPAPGSSLLQAPGMAVEFLDRAACAALARELEVLPD